MDNPTNKSKIPEQTKKNIIEFNENQYKKILERLEEIQRLKQMQKEKMANTRYLRHNTEQDLKKLEKINVPSEDTDSLKIKLKSLFYQLDDFNKNIESNNRVLDTIAMQVDKSKSLISKLNDIKKENDIGVTE
tara:strand:+ start:824 stop:1222 length:399 start_codon:yes stop_codon:yes gene_type:complete